MLLSVFVYFIADVEIYSVDKRGIQCHEKILRQINIFWLFYRIRFLVKKKLASRNFYDKTVAVKFRFQDFSHCVSATQILREIL